MKIDSWDSVRATTGQFSEALLCVGSVLRFYFFFEIMFIQIFPIHTKTPRLKAVS